MEPRLLRRGNAVFFATGNNLGMLQWSHAFSDVETALSVEYLLSEKRLQWSHAFSDVETKAEEIARVCHEVLQWSHAFSDVETAPIAGGNNRSPVASMEPRLLRRGNGDLGIGAERPARTASMEPRLLRRGNASMWTNWSKSAVASMEPRLLRRGNVLLESDTNRP